MWTYNSNAPLASEIEMTFPGSRRASVAAALLLTLSFGALAATKSSSQGTPPDIAIEHVTVLSMTGKDAQELPDATVIIHQGRITSVTAAPAQASVPKGTKRLDGTGKWLMP